MLFFRNLLANSLQKDLYQLRYASKSSQILVPQLDEVVFQGVKEGTMGPMKHAGRHRSEATISMDNDTVNIIKTVLGDSRVKILLKDSKRFLNYINVRQPPASKEEQIDKSAVCYWEVYNKSNVDFSQLSRKELKEEEIKFQSKADALLKARTYLWRPIDYSEYVGKQYLIERMVPEYAVLNRIFLEIASRCPNFKPHSLFDLCSGLGTVTRVARKYWESSIQEYYNVDTSNEMHMIARKLLTNGDSEEPLPIKNVYYRQFLPAKIDRKYSLTVCSYSLMEFPSSEDRLQSVWKLWSRTEDFMILVETGTAIGFKLILEARDFILETEKKLKSSTGIHIFAPCPHELECPLLKTWNKSCRYKVSYERLPIGRARNVRSEYYCYVVIRRGKRPDDDHQWPRVLKTPVKQKNRRTCHLCTNNGKLCSYMFRKMRHGKTTYQFSKGVKAGDRLPIIFTECDLTDFDEDSSGCAKEVTYVEELEGFSDGECESDAEGEK